MCNFSRECVDGVEKDDISITPIAVPLLAGPATIAGVVLSFGQARSFGEYVVVILAHKYI